MLASRPRSEAELRRRLQRRYAADVVRKVLAELWAQGLLNDLAFAQEWRKQREQHRPRGRGLIARELLSLGVEQEVVNEALAGFDAGENAYHAGHNYARRLEERDYIQFRKRLWGHLVRKGFQPSVIGETVRRLWRELADSLDRDEHACGDGH